MNEKEEGRESEEKEKGLKRMADCVWRLLFLLSSSPFIYTNLPKEFFTESSLNTIRYTHTFTYNRTHIHTQNTCISLSFLMSERARAKERVMGE